MTALAIKHPEVVVHLVGADGNAFSILGKAQQGLRRAGVPEAEIQAFMDDATSGSYSNLLTVVMQWVEVV